MPRIEHVALWTTEIDRLCEFYVRYFGARPAAPYRNPARGFESRFLGFEGGARLEVMRSDGWRWWRPRPGPSATA